MGELRLGMAAMIDKDVGNAATIKELRAELHVSQQEIREVRWANKVLCQDAETAAAALLEEQKKNAAGSTKGSEMVVEEFSMHAPFLGPPAVPFSPSTTAATSFSPCNPVF